MAKFARDPKQLGSLIRQARKTLGLSQVELASRAGLRQETISLIETGSPATRIDTLLRLMAALDLDLNIGSRSKTKPGDLEDIF